MLITTKWLLRKYQACERGYEELYSALGAEWPDNGAIPLSKIVETNGLEDAIWASRAVPKVQRAKRDKIARLFACWCVRQVWHLLTDDRSRIAVDIAERFAVGAATESELITARAAAWAAARAAERAAAMAAARAAARDAERDAERDAAMAAAMAAERAAAWAAAMAAAMAAERDAAMAAARAAERDAERDAAMAAARAAARDFQKQKFLEMLKEGER